MIEFKTNCIMRNMIRPGIPAMKVLPFFDEIMKKHSLNDDNVGLHRAYYFDPRGYS